MVPHAYATGGGFPDVSQLLLGTLMNSACTAYGKYGVQADQSAQLGRQDRPASVIACIYLLTCEHTLYHPKTDGSEGSIAYTSCAYSIASAILFQGCLSFAPCTSLQ
jgi:hypothetical protein